jgi:hypothetical protein
VHLVDASDADPPHFCHCTGKSCQRQLTEEDRAMYDDEDFRCKVTNGKTLFHRQWQAMFPPENCEVDMQHPNGGRVRADVRFIAADIMCDRLYTELGRNTGTSIWGLHGLKQRDRLNAPDALTIEIQCSDISPQVVQHRQAASCTATSSLIWLIEVPLADADIRVIVTPDITVYHLTFTHRPQALRAILQHRCKYSAILLVFPEVRLRRTPLCGGRLDVERAI